MWHPDHSGVLHVRVLQEYLLDLDGRDILTTGFDHVFQAIDEQHLAIFIDDTRVSLGDFRMTFGAMVRSRKPKSVYLRADRRVPYGNVVEVLAVIRTSGITNVGLVAEAEERP